MSILDIFKSVVTPAQQQPAQQPQQQPVQPGNIPANPAQVQTTQQGPGTAPNGAVPANGATEPNPASGLDAFKDIWNTNPAANQSGQPLFNVSQEKMMEAARKQNFTTGINPELAAKVAAGGQDAVTAMIEIMNTVAQNAYAQSAFAGTRLIEGALEKSNFAKASDLDTRFKSMTVDNALRTENPMFNHPAAQPILAGLKDQLLVKFPNATPTELTKMATDFLTSFASAANAPAQQQQQQQHAKAAKGEDWSNFV